MKDFQEMTNNLFLWRLIPLISIATLVGCASTIGSKNTQFVLQPKASNKPSQNIAICRPSAFYHGLNSMGVKVNSLPAFDLGSGERYLLAAPAGGVNLEFLIPNGNYSRYHDDTIKIRIPAQEEDVFIIVGHNKGADNALVDGVLFGMLGSLSTTTTWRAQALNRLSFEKSCGVQADKTIYTTDKSLN
jgi:hypothetical protein